MRECEAREAETGKPGQLIVEWSVLRDGEWVELSQRGMGHGLSRRVWVYWDAVVGESGGDG